MIEFLKYDERFLELSWNWLNDDEIRALTNTPLFDKETQRNWFTSLPSKSDYLIWGISFDSIPVGVCGMKNITTRDAEFWGYIGDKNYWRKGIGSAMLQFVVSEARKRNLINLKLFVLQHNIAALKLYEKSGFRIVKVENELIEMNKTL